MGFPLVPRSAA